MRLISCFHLMSYRRSSTSYQTTRIIKQHEIIRNQATAIMCSDHDETWKFLTLILEYSGKVIRHKDDDKVTMFWLHF